MNRWVRQYSRKVGGILCVAALVLFIYGVIEWARSYRESKSPIKVTYSIPEFDKTMFKLNNRIDMIETEVRMLRFQTEDLAMWVQEQKEFNKGRVKIKKKGGE